jgi:GT2 family glycosyltransferase
MQKTVFVIIPNYNGADMLAASIDSILAQSYKNFILVLVDNASVDDSRTTMEAYEAQDQRVRCIFNDKNYGYTGGVNPGLELAIKENADYAAPFNNDATADKDWLKELVSFLDTHHNYSIATCKLLHEDGKTFDSTADQYTVWGIPYPRGRDEPVSNKYDHDTEIFGASGGASMYRISMLRDIGLFDQDFFAYYEDIDLSFRAQLAGYKVGFVPTSIVYHGQGKTSEKMANGFTTKQYMKNLPLIIIKDLPLRFWWRVVPRFCFAYTIFFWKAIFGGRALATLQGWLTAWRLIPAKLRLRRGIQKNRKVSDDYIWSIIHHDLPPNAAKLRKLRAFWWKLTGRRARHSAR